MEFRSEIHRRSVRWLDGQADLDKFASIMLASAMAEEVSQAEAVYRAKSMCVSWLFERLQQRFEALKLTGLFADLLESSLLAIDYEDIAERAVDRAMLAMELNCQAAWREGVQA